MNLTQQKKGQLSLENAPVIVAIIGLTFLCMATVALVGEKFGASIDSTESKTIANESLTTVDAAGERVVSADACNFEDFTVLYVLNQSNNIVLTSSNYSTTSTGYVKSLTNNVYNNTNWKVTYSYSYAGTACNVTNDLQSEISNNSSIAGIILTISLVAIVLTILIGVFLGLKTKRV